MPLQMLFNFISHQPLKPLSEREREREREREHIYHLSIYIGREVFCDILFIYAEVRNVKIAALFREAMTK